jgi:hypothetical protein
LNWLVGFDRLPPWFLLCSNSRHLLLCVCLQVALTSPYAVPQVPLERVINNTIAGLNDGKLPSSAKQWVQMAGNAGSFVAKNMPFFMARALQVFMEGISVGGKPLTALPALQDTAIDASKALKALPQLLNMTMMGMDVAKITEMAEKLNIKMPTITNEMSSSIEELKKLPTLMQVRQNTRFFLFTIVLLICIRL